MPVNIPVDLPAVETFKAENIFVMNEKRARTQDIRPLEIAIVNLMPLKIETETQLLRLLSSSPLQIEVTLVRMGDHISKNTAKEHLDAFYSTFEKIKSKRFDGLLITGAPVETLPFEEVHYWHELCQIMEWSKTNVYSTMHICWGAQAGLFYHYGIDKYVLPEKLSGVYPHRVLIPLSRLMRGFDDGFLAPHSRLTGNHEQDILAAGLEILSNSEETGVYIAASPNRRQVFVTGHSEYDRTTLDVEYRRDIAKGLSMKPPKNYYQNDDPAQPPVMRWRSHAYLLFANWLNYYVYQETSHDLTALNKA
ncbi:MAG: homoserine O-succinyltransferase [Phycisphaerales bacterium]|nr:homoserine O-succinyltransferase [Phycisphaerales bacterium]